MSEDRTQPAARRPFSIGGCIVWVLAGIMFVAFLAALLPNIAASYPIPYLSQMFVTPQTVFSTSVPAAADQQQPISAPAQQQPGAAPWPTLTPEAQPTSTLPPAPTANLAPSKPGDNPGFSCGVEPGMDPNATCEETRPGAPQLSSVPKAGPRRIKERGSDKAGPQEGGE